MSKQQYKILYKEIAKPIWELAEKYESSYLMIENNLVKSDVVKAFKELKKVLEKQLRAIQK